MGARQEAQQAKILATRAISNQKGGGFRAGRVPGFIGDSITAGSGTSNAIHAFPAVSLRLSGSLHNSYANRIISGNPGFTTAQIAPLIGALLAQSPSYVVLEGGTNDAKSVSSDGDVPGKLATYQASMLSMMVACKSVGVPVIVCTIPPLGAAQSATYKRKFIAAANYWVKLVAPAFGFVADVFPTLVDTTTGDMLTAYDSDGTHPNEQGHLAWARILQVQIRALQGTRAGLVASLSSANLIPNPLMTGGSGSTLPTSYAEVSGGTGTAPSYATIADTTSFLPAGSWAEMDFDATAAGGTRRVSITLSAGWAVGDLLAVTGYVQVVDVSGDFVANAAFTGHTAQVISFLANQSNAGIQSDDLTVGNQDASGNWCIGPFMNSVTVPVGATTLKHWIQVTVPTGSHYKARFGALGVYNLTQLGLTGFGLS